MHPSCGLLSHQDIHPYLHLTFISLEEQTDLFRLLPYNQLTLLRRAASDTLYPLPLPLPLPIS